MLLALIINSVCLALWIAKLEKETYTLKRIVDGLNVDKDGRVYFKSKEGEGNED